MAYSFELKSEALRLRAKGYSIGEIATKLGITKSTSSEWTSHVALDEIAKKIIEHKKISALEKALHIISLKRLSFRTDAAKAASITLRHIKLSKNTCKLLCSIFIWTEGIKFKDSQLGIMNSDPKLMSVFLKLLRKSYNLDEKKFRALLHIHEYHNEQELKILWSKATNIPLSQFSKSYIKPHTGKRTKDGYLGSLAVRYYDFKIALELRSIYNAFAGKLGV